MEKLIRTIAMMQALAPELRDGLREAAMPERIDYDMALDIAVIESMLHQLADRIERNSAVAA